ncbi:hypothetical protein [Microseira sp. BLCC-F43]|uniref:hypothetical protein n=1 Tax=Microseira sp. BLCC-F43 TaxID=3153602 RepID=UPI0035B9DC83
MLASAAVKEFLPLGFTQVASLILKHFKHFDLLNQSTARKAWWSSPGAIFFYACYWW